MKFDLLKKSNRQRGFSLIEVQIAAFLLTIGIVALAQIHPDILYTSSEARARTDALTLAESKIEEFRSFATFAQYNALTSSANNEQLNATAGNRRSANYRRSWVVTEQASPANKIISVRVEWTDSRSELQHVLLSTRIAGEEPAEASRRAVSS